MKRVLTSIVAVIVLSLTVGGVGAEQAELDPLLELLVEQGVRREADHAAVAERTEASCSAAVGPDRAELDGGVPAALDELACCPLDRRAEPLAQGVGQRRTVEHLPDASHRADRATVRLGRERPRRAGPVPRVGAYSTPLRGGAQLDISLSPAKVSMRSVIGIPLTAVSTKGPSSPARSRSA